MTAAKYGARGLCCLALALLQACAVPPKAPEPKATLPLVPVLTSLAGANYQTPDSAVGMLQGFKHRLAVGYGIVPVPAMEKYLNQLLDKIKQVSGVSGVPGRVLVRASAGMAADTTADGLIYIDLGIIENATSEDELVGLLAHELGHIALGHFHSDVTFNGIKQLQSGVLTAAGLMVAFQGGTGQRQAQMQGRINDLSAMSDFASYVIDNVVLSSWTRGQERAADRFAVDASEKLGYSYEFGLKSMLEKIDQVSVEEGKKRRLRTDELVHQIMTKFCPPSASAPPKKDSKDAKKDFLQILGDDFKDALKSAAADGQKCIRTIVQQSGNNPEVARAFAQMDPGVAFFGDLARTHDKVDDRLSDLLNYRDKFYPDVASPEPRSKEWSAAKSEPNTTLMVRLYQLSLYLLNQTLGKQQEPEVAKLIAANSKNAGPFPAYALAQYQLRIGDRNGANQSLQNALSGNGYPALILWPAVKWNANLQIERRQPAQALAIYEQAYQDFGEPPNLLPEMVSFNRRLNNPARANALMTSCTFKYPAYKKVCQF